VQNITKPRELSAQFQLGVIHMNWLRHGDFDNCSTMSLKTIIIPMPKIKCDQTITTSNSRKIQFRQGRNRHGESIEKKRKKEKEKKFNKESALDVRQNPQKESRSGVVLLASIPSSMEP
jgi:hypothetical protein